MVFLRRSDPLDPQRPQCEIWQLSPADFAPRVPVTYRHLSDEVVETIFPNSGGAASSNGTFIAYFNQRKQLLSHWLTETPTALEAAGYRADPRDRPFYCAERESGPRPDREPAGSTVHLGPPDPRQGCGGRRPARALRRHRYRSTLAHALLDGRMGRRSLGRMDAGAASSCRFVPPENDPKGYRRRTSKVICPVVMIYVKYLYRWARSRISWPSAGSTSPMRRFSFGDVNDLGTCCHTGRTQGHGQRSNVVR